MDGREAQNVNRRQLCVVETAEEEPVGYVLHPASLWGTSMALTGYELKPGVSWLAVTPSVIRYLWAIGAEYATRDEKDKERETFRFELGAEHLVYAPFIDRLPRLETSYAWYLRVSDLPGFVRHIGPALERRLADSVAVGHTGTLKISLYRAGLQLAFEQGRLTEVTAWTPTPEDEGMAAFPDLTFLQLLFGYRTVEALETAFVDCWISDEHQEMRALLNVLFPRRPSDVWPVD
ncbi:MAG TPA: hypothetical protein ENN19_08555 [Chloroflexi bacterium]|nr:hypothetical protein [Chloroflexota bacterium]